MSPDPRKHDTDADDLPPAPFGTPPRVPGDTFERTPLGVPGVTHGRENCDTSEPVRVRVSGLGELIATVPYQLGYVPGPGVVTVAMMNGQVIGVLRVPAPDPASQWANMPHGGPPERTQPIDWAGLPEHVWDAAHRGLADALIRSRPEEGGAACAFVFGYEEVEGDALVGLDRMLGVCDELGLLVLDAVVVRDGRWQTAPGGPWEDVPDVSTVPAVAAFVLEGRAPAPDRGTVGAYLAEDPTRSEAIADAVDELAKAVARDDENERRTSRKRKHRGCAAARKPAGVQRIEREGLLGMKEWIAAPGIARRGQSPERTAAALLLLCLTDWRDVMYSVVAPSLLEAMYPKTQWTQEMMSRRAALSGCSDDVVDLLSDVAPLAPAGLRGELCAVIALGAWVHGNGVLASAAAEESHRDHPGQTMAELVLSCLDHGVAASTLLRGNGEAA